ncbi:cell division FtsA domain-containing protein [Lachnospiraceae bacterium 42-17]|nr:pilus assembly protein PilM [Dorea sp.]
MAEEQKAALKPQPEDTIFALDIGTRSIIGMVGTVSDGKINIIAIEKEEHTERAMIDGQIENIERVSLLAGKVKKRLEEKLNFQLNRVCVAAAGRALRTKRADYELTLPGPKLIDDEMISRLEAGAISRAEELFDAENAADNDSRRFYLVGYTVCQYYLDQYMISSLKDHRGKTIKADLIATFLPSEVVESLYTTMNKAGLDVVSITLEPIAAINAAIPENLRLLNLVMVDIGAGTSDIAVCTGGSIIGYTMATVAGDEITEMIMKEYLVDFSTAESIKAQIDLQKEVIFTDILGFEHTVSQKELLCTIQSASEVLCREIADKVLEVNGSAPSALFLAGGGSKLAGLKEGLTAALKMDANRIAIAGNNFKANAFSDEFDLNNPEYATPLGIVVSSGLNLINDSFRVTLNGKPAKLFRSGSFTALNLLMMNGYGFQDILGQTGLSLVITINGKRKIFYGQAGAPASLLINKKEGKLSDVIHAGDVIEFVPASPGVSASLCLGDLKGASEADELTLNGQAASLDTPLRNGDIVRIRTHEDAKEDKEKAAPGKVDETSDEKNKDNINIEEFDFHSAIETDSLDWEVVSVIDNISDLKKSKTILEEPSMADNNDRNKSVTDSENWDLSEEDDENWDLSEENDENWDLSEENNEDWVSHSSYISTAPSLRKVFPKPEAARPRPDILLHLNNAPLRLPGKENGEPYYLMDMIEYSGIDIKHPKGRVILTVNGSPGMFQQELKTGDIINIIDEGI